MSLYQSLYFMSLVGGMAGLLSWGLIRLMSTLITFPQNIGDMVAAVVIGGFLGGLTVAFSDHWSGNRLLFRWILSGIGLGCLAGLLGAAAQIPIQSYLMEDYPVMSRVLTWMLVGSFIGLGLGLRWSSVNRARVAHAFTGGLAGGAVGGLLFATLGGAIPDLTQAVSFVLLGIGISFGITLAPILLREGALQFVSSGDVRAQTKFGRTRKQWELQEGDFYVIGSQSPANSQTRYRPQVEIYIPDAAIAPRHATLFARDGRYYLEPHNEMRSPAALARYKLRVRGKAVSNAQELHDADDILIGRTALRFVERRRTG